MFIIVVLILIVSVSSRQLPPEINKCRLSDPKLGECLETSISDALVKFKNGNRDLGIVPLEPLVVSKLSFGNFSSGPFSVTPEYENLQIHHLTNTTFSDFEVDLSDDSCYWKFKGTFPHLKVEADYKMVGRMLVIQINGHGKCKNLFYDCVSTCDMKCKKYTKKGKKYIRVTDLSFKMSAKTINLDYENLIDGNEELTKQVLKTLNENSQSIYMDLGILIDDTLGEIFRQILDQTFSRVPEDELFLP